MRLTDPTAPRVKQSWIDAFANNPAPVATPTATIGIPSPEMVRKNQQANALAKARAEKNVPVRRSVYSNDPYVDIPLKGLAWLGDTFVKEPAKSLYRTFSGSNANAYAALPGQGPGAIRRLNALGEDAINIASVVPGAKALSEGIVAAEQPIKAAFTRFLENKTPKVDLENYIFHGGPTPENLVGGVIDPDYVRGGNKFAELFPDGNRGLGQEPSVLSGPNKVEVDYWKQKRNEALSAIGGNNEAKYFRDPQSAQSWLDRHAEILRRVDAGENHSTGALTPDATYAHMGSVHVLDVPPSLRTVDSPAPTGEVKFFGKQKPIASIPYVLDAKGNPNRSYVTEAWQAALDAADTKSMAQNKLANSIAKMRGVKITPAFKQKIEDDYVKILGRDIAKYYENPNFGKNDREILQYFVDSYPKNNPMAVNMEQVVASIRSAKTKDDIIKALQSTTYNEWADVDISNSLMNNVTKEELLNQVINKANTLSGTYSRLKKLPNK